MPQEVMTWLLNVGGALGVLCLLLLLAVGVLWRDNIRLRAKFEELQEKRIAEQKAILTDLTRVLQGQETQFREVVGEVRSGQRRSR